MVEARRTEKELFHVGRMTAEKINPTLYKKYELNKVFSCNFITIREKVINLLMSLDPTDI